MFYLKNVKYKNILQIKELTIYPEKVTCIIGESGSGKTTLLKLLNNMISSDEGIITYKGESISAINPIQLRRKVVMLNQNPAIFAGTLKDNLLIGLQFAERPLVKDKELAEVLGLVQLKKDLGANAEQMSGGEKQRLALARVLLLEPEVLLLDEPTSALDEETEKEVLDRIVQNTKARAASLVMITHSKIMAESYGDYIVEVKNGKIVSTKEGKHG
ncbi:MAG: ABC transporter ATP-binding protein [Bacillota bacterium]